MDSSPARTNDPRRSRHQRPLAEGDSGPHFDAVSLREASLHFEYPISGRIGLVDRAGNRRAAARHVSHHVDDAADVR